MIKKGSNVKVLVGKDKNKSGKKGPVIKSNGIDNTNTWR